jgi:DnaJ-domain-containing protein 1
MSAEQIAAAQSPTYVWPNETRAFSAAAQVDSPPKWSDFHDPLETISARFRGRVHENARHDRGNGYILLPQDRRMLRTLGLSEDADRKALRRRYSELVRKYHPDKNGGNRAHEKALQEVIAAYTHLKNISAFV